jgi:hypothetical protein
MQNSSSAKKYINKLTTNTSSFALTPSYHQQRPADYRAAGKLAISDVWLLCARFLPANEKP